MADKKVSVRMTDGELERIDTRVKQDKHRSRSDFIRYVLRLYLDGKMIPISPPLRRVNSR